MPTADLDVLLASLLEARAVTVVGASPNGYLTEHLLRNLRNPSCRFGGTVHFVNPGYRRLFGFPCVPSVADVEGEIGVLYLLVGLGDSMAVLGALPSLPTAVVLFAEGTHAGGETRPEERIAEWGEANGVPVLGPQSNGLAVTAAGLLGLVVPVVEDLRPGAVALLSQSGGILGGMVKNLSQRGVGIHSALETGTSCMLSMERLALALLRRDEVRLVAMYADSIGSLTDFAETLAYAEEAEKSVVFMIGGSSDAGGRAAASHSGMAATPRAVLAGLAAQYGALQVPTLDELVWSVEAIDAVGHRRFDGGRLALFSDSGGANVAMADAMALAGVSLGEPDDAIKRALGVPEGELVNPIDFGSRSMGQAESVNKVIAAVADDEHLGLFAFASILGLPRDEQSTHLGQIIDFADEIERKGKIAVVASLFPFLPTAQRAGSAVIGLGSIESAAKIRALASLARPDGPRPPAPPARTAAAVPTGDAPVAVTGADAEAALAELPLAWPRSVTVASADALAAAELPPFPLVVKSEAGLLHRAKAGGVLLGIEDDRVLASGVRFLAERFRGPVSISETVPHEAALFVGAFRTAGLLTILFGPGGGGAEETAAVRVAPLDERHLARLTREHAGEEGEAFARLLAAVQDWMAAHPDVESLDLNPVVPSEGRLVALDAKIQYGTP